MNACGAKNCAPELHLWLCLCAVVAAGCAGGVGLVGCSETGNVARPSSRQTVMPETRAGIRSTTDLRRLLVPGMTANEVTARLGKPEWEEATRGGGFWHYDLEAFPADDEMQGTLVIGVVVGFTNGCVADWTCAYADGAGPGKVTSTHRLRDTAGGTAATLSFFEVRDHPVEQGRYIDTEWLPTLGYISAEPDLVVDRLAGVTMEQKTMREPDASSRTVYVFKCSLAHRVATQFKAMTTTNLLKRVLIMVGDEPVIAPTILAPVEDGQFQIECDHQRLMESVRKALSEMERRER